MPDIGWSELLLIAVIAIVVVGPKELPNLLRMMGRGMTAARRAANEFRSALDDLAREADEAAKPKIEPHSLPMPEESAAPLDTNIPSEDVWPMADAPEPSPSEAEAERVDHR